jgi:hypothetical protein
LAGGNRPSRGNRAHAADAGADDLMVGGAGTDDAATGNAMGDDATTNDAAAPSPGNRRQPRGRRKAGAAAKTSADAADEGSSVAALPSDAPAFSQADADVSGGAAGVRLGMDESPASVGRRPGRNAQRRRNNAETTPSSDASSTPGMPESVEGGASLAPATAAQGDDARPASAGTANAGSPGDAGAADGNTAAGTADNGDSTGDTTAPAKRAAKSARKSPRPAPARSRLPRKPKEG